MPVDFEIENVPDYLAERIRQRARRHRRTLQDELLAMLELLEGDPGDSRTPLSLDEVWERARARGISSPDEAAAMIRADRDSR